MLITKRAKRGSTDGRLFLKLPADLQKEAKKDAKRLGISVSEWWRLAAQALLAERNAKKGGR